MRFWHLYLLSIKAFFHKLRYDLINEIVVGICSVVLILTFIYIFNDFLNDKIQSISKNMRHIFAICSSVILLIIMSFASSRYIKADLANEASLFKSSYQMGECPTNINVFVFLRIITVLFVFFGIYWFITYKYLIAWPLETAFVLQILSLLLVGGFLLRFIRFKSSNTKNEAKLFAKCTGKTFRSAMIIWRLKQIILRNRLTRACLIIAFVCALVVNMNIFINGAYFVSIFISFIAGFFVSISMNFQLKEDLDYAWAERSMGISHQMFQETYQDISKILSVGLVLVIFIGCFINFVFLQDSTALTLVNISDSFKLMAICSVAPLIAPHVMFQIDARRPMIQVLVVLMVGLFTATALYASWLALLLFPIIKYYGIELQKGRFYRA